MGNKTKLVALWLAVALAAAGCGATHSVSHTASVSPTQSVSHAQSVSHSGTGAPPTSNGAGNPPAFAWLRPGPAPADWPLVHLLGATVLAYPPNFSRVKSDPGTASAARVDRQSGLITEYLNATPRQGDETLANWASFRPAHNREEGDSREQVLAAARNLRFRNGRGSCVIDRYATSRTSYQEIACLVHGPAGQTVIVASAQTARWAQDAPALERAVSAFEA